MQLAPAVLVKQSSVIDTYIAAQHVKQLRKSINPSALQEVTDLGGLPGRTQPPWSLHCRPKAKDLKCPAPIADPRSALENRTSALTFYCQGDNHDQGQGERQ